MKRRTKPDVTAEDSALFRAAVADARPLVAPHADIPRERPLPIPIQTLRDEQRVLQQSLVDADISFIDVETGDELVYRRPELAMTTLRKLKRGQIAIQAALDLHGMTTAEAANALSEFLRNCLTRGLRAVRIIHGKGHGSPQKRPVLKGKVGVWLQRRDDVLAYCSARVQDGGTGAIYVLLRAAKSRDDTPR